MAQIGDASSQSEDFLMTWEWLHAFSTPGGGWTAKQLRVIGVEWPPVKGWLTRSIGIAITKDQKALFEQLHAERQEYLKTHRRKMGVAHPKHRGDSTASIRAGDLEITIRIASVRRR